MSQAGPHEWWCMLYVSHCLAGSLFSLCSFYRPNGVQFSAPAGTTEFSKRWLPKQGDIVSFKHRGFLDGTKKPKLPLLYRIRDDLKWDDVVHNWKEKRPIIAGNNLFLGKPLQTIFYLLITARSCTSEERSSNGYETEGILEERTK